MENMHETLRTVRERLRWAMNGVLSASMREKGVVYKLNFGVPYPEIKEIASHYEPSLELAAALWKEDIREFKVLATLLCPSETFPIEGARRWVSECPYLEIAEHCAKNLFVRLPYMEQFTLELIQDAVTPWARTIAFLTWTDHFRRGNELSVEGTREFLAKTFLVLGKDTSLNEKHACVQALKFYGRTSEEKAVDILSRLERLIEKKEHDQRLQAIYSDLKFEFEYYR